MEAFWDSISLVFLKKTVANHGIHACTVWTGAREHGVYGKKVVVWPDGQKKTERVHRLSFMLHHRILRANMPSHNEIGEPIEVSHICHNSLCIRPDHLVLETHRTNMGRNTCKQKRICSQDHNPPCLI